METAAARTAAAELVKITGEEAAASQETAPTDLTWGAVAVVVLLMVALVGISITASTGAVEGAAERMDAMVALGEAEATPAEVLSEIGARR